MASFRLTGIYFGKKFIAAFGAIILATIVAVLTIQSQLHYIGNNDQHIVLFNKFFSTMHRMEQITSSVESENSATGRRTIDLLVLKQSAWDLARNVKVLQQYHSGEIIAGVAMLGEMPEEIEALWAGKNGIAHEMLKFSNRIDAINLTRHDIRPELVEIHLELEHDIQPRLISIIDILQKTSLDRILMLSTALFAAAALMVLVLAAIGFVIFQPMRNTILRTQSALSDKINEQQKLNTLLANREADAVRESLLDGLTTLPNRRAFTERLDIIAQVVSAGRDAKQHAVILVDLDRFKQINDTLGHQTGDAVLVTFAERLGAFAPQGAFVARLGGDEFALIVSARDTAAIEEICADLLAIGSEPVTAFEQIVHCGVSVGAATIDAAMPTAFETLKRSDLALYVAKSSGRNCYRVFVPKFAEDFECNKRLQDDLRDALPRDEIHLVYQPIVSHTGKRVLALEALMRWQHPELGAVPPDEFILAAEESGQIRALGTWALRQAMNDTKKFDNVPVAFNLSPVQLRHKHFIDEVMALAAETQVDPTSIEFEITESVLIDDADLARNVMDRLKQAGFSIALDDFGTGYSSFGYLRDFPFDKIKIDKSFVSQIDKDPEAAALVDAMINVGRALNINVVAEGVETEGERQILQAAGCAQMQGFLFCKPELVGHLQTVLAKNKEEAA